MHFAIKKTYFINLLHIFFIMNNFLNFFKGILIGSGAILPGVSSGVLCVILGIYETLLNRLLNFFKNPYENFKFFFPIALGGLLGIFLVGKLLLFLLNNFYMPTCFCFIGLILGCIPSILKQTSRQNNRILHILCLLLTLSFSIYLVTLEYFNIENTVSGEISTFDLGLGGFLMSAGVVIPGVSSSVILMIMGIYETYLNAIATVNLYQLLPLGFGLLLGGLLFLKLIQYLFKNFRSYTYYAIIGFTIGSIFVLFPGFSFDITGLVSIVLFMVSFIVSMNLGKIK